MFDDPNAIAYRIIQISFWLVALGFGGAACFVLRRRRYAASGFLAATLLAWIIWGIPLGLSPGSEHVALYQLSAVLYGKNFWIDPSYQGYHSEVDIHGDRYWIEVYAIPDSLAAFLKNPPANFTTDFPIDDDSQDDLKMARWRPTPVPAQDEYLEFATAVYSGVTQTQDAATARDILIRLAKQPGSWYAYHYRSSGSYVSDIDYWLVCPEERIMVWVTHFT